MTTKKFFFSCSKNWNDGRASINGQWPMKNYTLRVQLKCGAMHIWHTSVSRCINRIQFKIDFLSAHFNFNVSFRCVMIWRWEITYSSVHHLHEKMTLSYLFFISLRNKLRLNWLQSPSIELLKWTHTGTHWNTHTPWIIAHKFVKMCVCVWTMAAIIILITVDVSLDQYRQSVEMYNFQSIDTQTHAHKGNRFQICKSANPMTGLCVPC